MVPVNRTTSGSTPHAFMSKWQVCFLFSNVIHLYLHICSRGHRKDPSIALRLIDSSSHMLPNHHVTHWHTQYINLGFCLRLVLSIDEMPAHKRWDAHSQAQIYTSIRLLQLSGQTRWWQSLLKRRAAQGHAHGIRWACSWAARLSRQDHFALWHHPSIQTCFSLKRIGTVMIIGASLCQCRP